MHFDALTLACITDELKLVLHAGRVQQVLLPDEHSIGLEIYASRQRHYLLLSADPQAGRVQLGSEKLRRGAEQTSQLLLLLRKYVRDSLLMQISQPDPTERLLELHFTHAEHGPTTLIIEIIGQRSNLILLNANQKIMDCQRRIVPGEQVQRVLLPGRPYTPPPAQHKLSPLDDGSPDYYAQLEALTQVEGKLWKGLTAGVAGISPTAAREIAWRITGNMEAVASAVHVLALAQTLQELWAPVRAEAGYANWQPGLWVADEGVVGFSAYPAHIPDKFGHGTFVPAASLSAALEQFYTRPQSERPVTARDAYAALRANVAADLRRAHTRVQRQLSALAGDEPAPGAAEQIRQQAEWLLALSSQIQPDQTVLEADLGDGETLQITLDSQKTPVAQAQQMFKTARKWDRALQVIPVRRAKLQLDLEFLDQLRSDLLLAENQPEIVAVREELQRTSLLAESHQKQTKASAKERPKERTSQPASQPLRYFGPTGFAILVGRNARQNDLVTFKLATAEDRWLHVRGVPGSHVVIRNGGQPIDDETLRIAAQLAAYYSSVRGERAVEVSVTQRRFVTRVPGGRPGQVYMRNEQTVTVPAELPAR